MAAKIPEITRESVRIRHEDAARIAKLKKRLAQWHQLLVQVRHGLCSPLNGGDRAFFVKLIDSALAGDGDLHPSLSHKRPPMTG